MTEEIALRSGGCFIELTGDRLSVGNERFRRTWRVGPNGLLSSETFRDLEADVDWLVSPSVQAVPPEETYLLSLHAVPKPSVIEADCLTAELTATGERQTRRYLFQVFPECRGVRVRLTVAGEAGADGRGETTDDQAGPTGVEADTAPPGTRDSRETDALDALTLAPLHLRLTQVTLRDQTDSHNELVSETEWLLHPSEAPLMLSGCLFSVEDVLTSAGLIFLKEAPLPHARPVPCPHDLHVYPGERRFTFAGHGAGGNGVGYASATLAYAGGKAGRTAALQQYQRCLRPYVPARDALLVSNTWGDRNRDGRINADFMAQEIEAGARLGVDVIQIDDGWQVGATSNSVRAKSEGGVWEGFYAAHDDFWAVNPARFPLGLAPLVAEAREKNMRFGLWFGPDSAGDFANWRRDADTVLRLHRDLGIDYFKIDGVKIRSQTGERRLYAFFDAALTESAGRIVFDLDVTAEVRPGYFGLVCGGPLFVENRYTDWHRYWPHQTLRSLWQLSHHVDPVRLRMEFLNHARNDDKYAHDPLAPSAYRPDYLFATVMFSSPLGWFEASNLPETYFTEAAPLISVWKQHREAIFSGTILPLGNAPDGMAWTGFASLAPDRLSAYILVFREASPLSEWQTTCPFLPDVAHPVAGVHLGGDGDATLLPGRRIAVTIPEARRFLFVQFHSSGEAEQGRAKKPQSESTEKDEPWSWE